MRSRECGVTLIEVLIAVTLLSMLSVGMLFAMRVGLNAMEKTNSRVTSNRRSLGVERIVTQQIAGFIPAVGVCPTDAANLARVALFQGHRTTIRFVSSYSLQEASRGYPRILEFQVIPGENGQGVRLIVNETLYTGPAGSAFLCGGIAPDPATGRPGPVWRPVVAGPNSFVLADKLARCEFSFQQLATVPQEPDVWVPHWNRDFTPAAIRIDMTPLEPDPARIQVPSVVVPLRVTRQAMFEVED